MSTAPRTAPFAYLGGLLATDLLDVVDLSAQPDVLDRGGWWAVLATFEGRQTGYRFGNVRPTLLPAGTARWAGPDPAHWRSSLDEADYLAGVQRIRRYIEAGDVYQVNLCRILSAPLPDGADPLALATLLAAGNPAPHQGVLRVDDDWVVTASPELFLSRSGDTIASAPIKGTTYPAEPFADKDYPENIMITDLVRNDLGRIGRPGSVAVTGLLERQEHPGLAHLVSTVTAELAGGVGWADILAATFPPGSVTGAPKIRAQQVISELEPVDRGPYCGAIGYVDADVQQAVLAVGIRTFFTSHTGAGRRLHFGTGAGITYASDPAAEWRETELKAARLIGLASST
ncbi:MAG: chorismate-binding protein [Nakamurella sp.]